MIRFRSVVLLLILLIDVVSLWPQQHRDLQIVFTAPAGETASIDQSARIVVTFNEPMVALAALPRTEASGPLKIEPALHGTYRWLGTTTLAFTPADTLPYGSQYTVTIPAGTSSLSGAQLKTAYSWSFETPRPVVVSITPGAVQRYVELDHTILLEFNQPVDPRSAGASLSIVEHWNGSVSYPAFSVRTPALDELSGERNASRVQRDVQQLRDRQARSLRIIPAAPFHKGSSVTTVVKAGFQGRQGRLGMTKDYSSQFTTYGELLFVGASSDDNFNPGFGIKFEFTNPVSYAELLSHLTMDPAAASSDTYASDYQSPRLYAYLKLKPEQTYTCMITRGMKDMFGNTLAADAPFTFRTTAYTPYVRMTTGPGLLEAHELHQIPVSFMNTDSVRVRLGAVATDRIVPMMTASDFWGNEEWESSLLSGPVGRPAARTWKTAAARNTAVTRPLELNAALGGSAFGVVYVEVKNFSTLEPRVLKTVVQVTNIGVTAKFSPDSMLVWATRLNDVSPAPDADVEIRTDSNRVVWRGRTDAHGVCIAPGWGRLGIEPVRETYGQHDEFETVRPPRLWVIVSSNGDRAFTSSQWNEGIEPYAFGIEADWNPQLEKYEASVFTDRGLYQANETVNVKGIVRMRRAGEWQIDRHARVRVRVLDTRNDEVLSRESSLSAFGSFALRLPLKAAAPTGTYRITVEVPGGTKANVRWSPIATGSFRVEAFRPAEFEVTAKTERDRYIIGDTVRGYVNARYLFGAPMKHAPVRWRFSLSPADFVPTGYDNYYFGIMDWLSEFSHETSHALLASGAGQLDAFGSTTVDVPLRTGDITGTVSLMLEGDAVSTSRQTLSGRTSVLVHGGEYELGIKPSSTFLQADTALSISLVTVSPEGIPIPGKAVSLKLFNRMWHSVRKAETGGRYAWQSEVADSLVDSTAVTTTEAPSVHVFIPRRAGFYYISAVSVDPRGNRLESQATFYVSGRGYVAWDRNNDDRIDLVADKTNYRMGETAKIIVKNPYESATALVTIEREGILRHYTTLLTGSAPQIDIPIEARFLPNVFVSVVLLQGRIDTPAQTEGADIGRPSFKVGFVKLPVSPKEKALTVQLSASQKEYRPGDSVSVMVHVRTAQARGVAAEAALSIADLGVLNLINYRLPDPFDEFYRERGLAVTTTETRLHLIEQRAYGEKGEDAGGGGANMFDKASLDEEGIRKEFRPSAYWNPAIVTDDSGYAVVRFKLPDNITSFKAMAVAHTVASEFGEGEAAFAVNKPVLLQPSLPRFARVGDTFDAGIAVMNNTAAPRTVLVRLSAAGIRTRGLDSVSIELQPGQSRELTCTFTADRIGTAVVTAKAESGGDKDGLRWTFPVAAPRSRETVAMFNSSVDAKKEEAIAPPGAVYANAGGVEFSAASTALVGLSGGMSYLFTYPYGCLEQRASSVLPIVLAQDLVDAFGFEVFKGKNTKQVAQRTIDELALFQKFNGGFSYWKTDNEAAPYVSAYAVYTLIQAQRHGYAVDTRVLENGLQYLTRVLHGDERDARAAVDANRCTQALIAYTFALAGRPEFGLMDKMFADRGSLPLFAQAYLLKAVALSVKNSPMASDLARSLMNHVKVDPVSAHFEERNAGDMSWIFTSTTRTTALILQALIETNTENDLVPKMVRWLLNAQRNGRWRTTQENVYVVDALASYFQKYEHEAPQFNASIAVEGRKVLAQRFAGRSTATTTSVLPLSALPNKKTARVTISKDGTGRLYYGMRMTYYPMGASAGRDEGVTVLRSMEPVEEPAGAALKSGMLLKVTVSVIAPQDRNYLVIEDPVPAGFEIASTSFATTASTLTDDREYASVFGHVERYDDRIALFADRLPAGIHSYTYLVRCLRSGTFELPSTHAECMYEPEIFGTTASGTVTVK